MIEVIMFFVWFVNCDSMELDWSLNVVGHKKQLLLHLFNGTSI